MERPKNISWNLCLLFTSLRLIHSNQIINIYTLGAQDDFVADAIAAARNLALKHINNNEPKLLPNYTLQLTPLNTEGDRTLALQRALEIKRDIDDSCSCSNSSNTRNLSLPIVLGCPSSSSSSITAPVMDTINWAQISSSSTSTLLSDNDTFPTFYRTISDDSLQAAGIVGMLEYFNWTKVAVIYPNNLYGGYLAVEIMNLASAKESAFKIIPIAHNQEDIASIRSAVHQLSISNIFVTVLISGGRNLPKMISALQDANLFGYPYYYIGVDAWMFDHVMKEGVLAGYIGTAPWAPHMLSAQDYNQSSDLQNMYNASSIKVEYFKTFWEEQYALNSSWANGFSSPRTFSYYGWDSTFAAVYVAKHILDARGSLDGLGATDIEWIDDILTNHVKFTGVTGNVSFAGNGDRDKGLFAFGNMLENGTVSWIGYFSEYYNVTYVNYEAIVWPQDFREKEMTPRTSVLVRYEKKTIHSALLITIISLAAISIFIAIGLMVLTATYSSDPIIRAASWKLNITVCIGTVMAYIFVILSGLDEAVLNEPQLDVMCAVKPWFLFIGFTLGAMSLFLKTYRVSIIFTESLNMESKLMTDLDLMKRLICCVIIDLLILSARSIVSPRWRQYEDGSIETIDQLQRTQYQYGLCLAEDTMLDTAFKTIISFWKICQILFGIFCCSIVSRISNEQMRDLKRKFDESSTQLVAVVTIILLGVAVLMSNTLLADDRINWQYVLESAGILAICNLCLIMNLCPRLIAIWKGDQDKYISSLEDEMRKYMIAKMNEFSSRKLESKSQCETPDGIVTPSSNPPSPRSIQQLSKPQPLNTFGAVTKEFKSETKAESLKLELPTMYQENSVSVLDDSVSDASHH